MARRTARALLACILCLIGAEADAQAQAAPPQPAPEKPASTATDAASTAPDAPTWHPAAEADPPLLPAPTGGAPISTSGTDVEGDARAFGAASDPALEKRIAALEAKLAESRRREKPRPEMPWFWRHVRLGGFVQPQFVASTTNAAGSPNRIGNALPAGISANDVIARPDGTTTNRTLFRLRRTRLRTTFETDAMRFYLQIEALPLAGEAPVPSTIVRNAEATGKIRWTDDIRTELTAGLFMVPFRYELTETSNVRPFVERTTFAQSAFPLERDLGIHAKTTAIGNKLTVDVAVVNGQRLGEPAFTVLPDLNPSKDFVLWGSYALGPFLFGANGYYGRGQIVDAQALRFKQFDRWAVNGFAQAKATFFPRFGESRALAELTFGENMDTGLRYPTGVPVIPAAFGADVAGRSQRAFYIRVEQELGRWLLAGYRYDVYVPDTALKNNGRDTHSFLAGARFSHNLRLMNELFYAIDNVHPAGTLPPSATVFGFSSVLQAQF